jgi:cellulose synthase/poly-beta-1,6-N-acetylglucosamine synthase-like glycosyltransferase
MPRLAALLVFWLPLVLMCYNWIGFPLILWMASRFVPRVTSTKSVGRFQSVTIAVAAWNEEQSIAGKIENCLALDYPRDKFEVLVGTDATTDLTDQIVRSYAPRGVILCDLAERVGKSAVLNMLIVRAQGDSILFTDADVVLAPDALQFAVSRFDDPKVGVVLFNYARFSEQGHVAEGLWDRYENWLKGLEGRLGSAVGAYGWAMLVRRSLCAPLPPDTILDDYVLGTRPFLWGYDVVYEPRARSWTKAESPRIEFSRKVRNSRGTLQAFLRMPQVFLPKYGVKAWVLVSHKLLRALVPFLMFSMLVGSALAWSVPFFKVATVVQAVLCVTTPLVLVARGTVKKLLFPQYFVWANVALAVGYWEYFFGRKLGHNWTRTRRVGD